MIVWVVFEETDEFPQFVAVAMSTLTGMAAADVDCGEALKWKELRDGRFRSTNRRCHYEYEVRPFTVVEP